ncbi:hypothetical protein EAX61_14675 [Dokdonia sinensis]|uniref:Uncharacterized protein n=1 Tax=Dokdonia sinensis TaxID=2479847 RepID=A0A3M0FWH1_9FLAO|nr:DUF6090 family protein [Dokdonia sinensis]RMB56327.1 hypothetical protein EAX61_14675 [Dokdonia sinensis]
MIKFFRRIRQQLLSENKFSKYLLYAIGEIVLVVIGILIALQINNWNESRIRSKEELSILKSLKTGLETDLEDLRYNANSIRKSIGFADKVIMSIEKDDAYHDSIPDQIGIAMFPVKFVYSTTAFETLKAKGIDLLSNIQLRDAIVGVYDSGYDFFIETEKAITLDEAERGLVEVFPEHFEESYVFNFDKQGFEPRLIPLDFERLKQDQEFRYFLKSYRNRLDIFSKFHYNTNMIPQVENLIGLLDKEINRLEP